MPEDSNEKSQTKIKKSRNKILEESDEKEHPLITDLDYREKDKKRMHKAALWFERDGFQNLLDEKDEDADLDKMIEEYKKKGAKISGEDEIVKDSKSKKNNKSIEALKKSSVTTNGHVISDKHESSDSDSDTDSDSDSDYDISKHHVPVNNAKKDGFEIVKEGVGKISRFRHFLVI